MTCMTTKQKFDLPQDEVPVVVLANGRYAYRVKCPWEGKGGKPLFAFKFCSANAYHSWQAKSDPHTIAERPESPIGDEEEEA